MVQIRKQVLWDWKILSEIDEELKVLPKDPIKTSGFLCAKCVYLHVQSSDFLIHFHTDGDKMLKS